MDIIVISGFCVTAAVLCRLLEADAAPLRALLAIAAAALVFLKTAEPLGTVISGIRSIFSESGADEEYLRILIKGLGICYITELACGMCRDCGENALASQLLLAGKISLLVISLPMFGALIDIVRSLLI